MLLRRLALVGVAAGAAVLLAPVPAFAHTSHVTGALSCDRETHTTLVTWTIFNDYQAQEKISGIVLTPTPDLQGVTLPTTIAPKPQNGPDTSVTFSYHLPSATTPVTIEFAVAWSDGYTPKEHVTGTATGNGNCPSPSPSPSHSPSPSPIPSVTTSPPAPHTPSPSPIPSLPTTGFPAMPVAAGGAALVLVGGGLVVAARRRRGSGTAR